MAAPSVSLEGKNLWLLQSLPVKPWQALRAKLTVQLLLTGIPALFCHAPARQLPARLDARLKRLLTAAGAAGCHPDDGAAEPDLWA